MTNSVDVKFSPEDVRILAQTVIDGCETYDDYHGDHCRHCNGRYSWGMFDGKWQKNEAAGIIHKSECPVLVAKDCLTGLE